MAFLTLVLFASYVLIGRVAVTLLPDYRQQLEQYLSEQTQIPIAIESLQGSWVGFDPVIVVGGLKLNGAENAYIGSIRIHVAILKSLLSLAPRIRSITLNHSVFTLRQQHEGSWQIAGVDLEDLLQDKQEAQLDLNLASLFDGTHFTLNDNHLSVYSRKDRLRNWRFPVVSLDYQGDQVFASGRILQPEGTSSLVSFSYQGEGVLSADKVQGSLYLEARSSRYLDEVLKAYEWHGIALQDIDASARMWVAMDGARISQVQGDFQISELNWKAREKSLPPMMNVAASFQWTALADQSQLDIHWNGFSWAGQRCEPTSARVQSGTIETRIAVSALDVQCLSRIAVAMDVLPVDLQSRLEVSDPFGYLTNIELVSRSSQSSIDDLPGDAAPDEGTFQLEAELNNVSLGAYSGTPGVNGIDGYIVADALSGSVIFDSSHFELAFPDLFLKSWKMKRTEGSVSWLLDGDDVAIYSEGLRLRMVDDSLVYGDFALRLNPLEKEDYLSLALGLQDVAFEDVTRFVPYYLIDEAVYHWLDQSMLDGRVASGIYRGYGSIEGDDSVNSFTSSLQVETQHGELTFAEGWPNLSDLNAQVDLQNGALEIAADTATIHGTPLSGLVAMMPESEGDSASVLNAKARIRADENVLQYWLSESPVAEHTSVIAEQIRIKGLIDVDLDIDVPMDAALPVDYEITNTLTDIEVEHPDASLVFKHVSGQLDVSSRTGVSASNIQVELLGQPAALSISTVEERERSDEDSQQPGSQTVLRLNGRTSVAALLDNYQLEPVLGLSGEFAYQSELRLPENSDENPLFTLSSDLTGVSQDWPAPFDKAPDEAALLKLALMIKPDQMYVNASIESEHMPRAESELLYVNSDFSYGEVRVGNVDPSTQATQGLSVRAAIPELELEPWIAFVQTLTASTDDELDDPVLERLDLDMDQLNAFGQSFSHTRAFLNREPSQWAITLRSNDIMGSVFLPLSGGAAVNNDAITAQFEHLFLRSQSEDIQRSPDEQKMPAFDPRELPRLAFSSEKLVLNDQNYGAWRTQVEPNETGAIFREIEGIVGGASVHGQLNWQRLTEQQHNSILTLDIRGDNVETFVDSMGWPSAVSSDEYQAEIALVWPDEPTAFELASVSGSIVIQMKDGALKTADEKTGALRLFGILNADAIFKRLTLDFSDLFESGISYDELSVRATIDQGQLTLEEPLLIDGPSSGYVVNGTADLTKKTLDMDMLVELPFSQNVPLAALVLGAPQIGGVVWLVDKMLGEPLSAITTARYDITGSWEKPKVEMQQAINASKKKRNKKEGLR